jgi:hypothetical protein
MKKKTHTHTHIHTHTQRERERGNSENNKPPSKKKLINKIQTQTSRRKI